MRRTNPDARLRLGDFGALTFDCYGTLIDWEAGLLTQLRPWAKQHVIEATDEQCLANIHRRNEEKPEGIYAGFVSDETFHAVTAHFLPPQVDEEFRLQMRQCST